MEQVPETSRPLVYKLIGMVVAGVTPMASSTAEIYTAFGRRGLETAAMFDWVLRQASAAAPYKKPDANLVAEPLPGLSIVVSHGPWLTALAELGSIRALPSPAIHVLESHADDPSVHEIIVRALANQPGLWDQPCWRSSCRQLLSGFPTDAARRQLAAEVLAERLAKVPRPEFVTALEKLRN